MHEAKSKLSGLVRSIEDGSESEVVICRSGQTRGANHRHRGRARVGSWAPTGGRIAIAPDFDSVNDEIAALFEGS